MAADRAGDHGARRGPRRPSVDPPAEGGPGLRLGILGIVVLSLFSVLLARLWSLQILTPEMGEEASAANRLRVVAEEAPRGRILDDRGRVLVDNRTAVVVTLDRHALDGLDDGGRRDALLHLAGTLTRAGVPTKVADIERRLADPEYHPLLPVPVAMDVPDELLVLLGERADEFPGVEVRRQAVRRYPNGSLAAHVLGYVGRITAEELADRNRGTGPRYEPDGTVGRAGVERTLEADLRGTPGQRTVEVDRKGRVVRVVDERPPVPGNDVQLTIDLDAQRLAEARLAGQLESLRGRTGGRGTNDAAFEGRAGAVAVVDPRNGDVTAMASYPTYDPTEFVNGISTEAYRRLSGNGDPEANALINRAITGQYAPGSTFKLVSAYAALSRGVITPRSTYDDKGSYVVGNSRRRNAEGASNGPVDVTSALTVSSDVFFYWIGDQFWSGRGRYGDGLQQAARDFGLGAPTGIALPGEASGVVPDPAWKQRLWESMPPDQQARGDGRWYGGDTANLAIGQGDLLVTPLQLANAYATFAARGVRYRPNLVHRVLSPGLPGLNAQVGADGARADLPACPSPAGPCVVRAPAPVVAGRVDLAPEVHDAIEAGLAGVTTSARGTATYAFRGFDQEAFPLLGKTGTVEAGEGRADNAAFVGAGPVPDPRVVAVAYLEHVGFGSEAAAPVVRSLFEQASGQEADPCVPVRRDPLPCRGPVVAGRDGRDADAGAGGP
jgi:penicillin-binding protein 2